MGKHIISYPSKPVTLVANILTTEGVLANQPANYPKIYIDWMKDDGSVVNKVNGTVMTKDKDGEYFYNWITPDDDLGTYKIKYEAIVDGITIHGFETLDNFTLEAFLDGHNYKRVFTYNVDKSVDKITFTYGSPAVATYELRFTYNIDKTINDMQWIKI